MITGGRKESMIPRTVVATMPLCWLLLLLQLALPDKNPVVSASPIPCRSNDDCINSIGAGGEGAVAVYCRSDGWCSNPYESGCLFGKNVPGAKKRVCNSDDPPEALAAGVCRPPVFDYKEVRMVAQDWLSAIFGQWVLQILLSEILDVPATLETGSLDADLNFYSPVNMQNSTLFNASESLERGTLMGDCNLALRTSNADSYEVCANVLTEVWDPQLRDLQPLVDQKLVERPQPLGVPGMDAWYIPLRTARADPTLVSWLGYLGEEKRHKLAGLFKRPTTWQYYCDRISTDHCATADDAAERAPQNEEEGGKFFVAGLYTGHFRDTEKNNCTAHPTTCTGHIADHLCMYGYSFVPQICHHLNIALSSEGHASTDFPNAYAQEQAGEIWLAANATQSDVIVLWFTPDGLVEEFLGTDYEFKRVDLPTPTPNCVQHKINPYRDGFEDRLGTAEGACDYEMHPLYKFIAASLRHDHVKGDVLEHGEVKEQSAALSEAAASPGLDAVHLFTLSELDLRGMFQTSFSTPSNREAVCQWVVDNLSRVKQAVPLTYPRVVYESEDNQTNGPLLYISTILGGLAALFVLWTSFMVHRQRNRLVMKYAQKEFLWILLLGLLCVSVAAMVVAVPPTDATCMATVWLVNLGYTLELVPLIVKVAAINRLMNASKKMRRVVLTRKSLFGAVAGIVLIALVFLVVWTAMDPPARRTDYVLTDEVNDRGDTVVLAVEFCRSAQSNLWWAMSAGWILLLLVAATVLAFQTRNIQQSFNESKILATMIYSHTVFAVLRVIILFLPTTSGLSPAILSGVQSLLLSLDTIATICIYFVTKFTAPEEDNWNPRSSDSRYSASNVEKRFTKSANQNYSTGVDSTEVSGPLGSGAFTRKPSFAKSSAVDDSEGGDQASAAFSRKLSFAPSAGTGGGDDESTAYKAALREAQELDKEAERQEELHEEVQDDQDQPAAEQAPEVQEAYERNNDDDNEGSENEETVDCELLVSKVERYLQTNSGESKKAQESWT